MAHFIGYLEGSRGPASRLGTAKSGITARAQGWNLGAKIECSVNEHGQDVVAVWITSGSNSTRNSKLLGIFTELPS